MAWGGLNWQVAAVFVSDIHTSLWHCSWRLWPVWFLLFGNLRASVFMFLVAWFRDGPLNVSWEFQIKAVFVNRIDIYHIYYFCILNYIKQVSSPLRPCGQGKLGKEF